MGGGAFVGPVLGGVWIDPQLFFWPVSAICVYWLCAKLSRHGLVHRVAAMAAVTTFGMANIFMLVSLFLQGTGFNEQFFFHLEGSTARIAISVYPVHSALAVVCLVLPVIGLGEPGQQQIPQRLYATSDVGLLAVVSLALNAPLHALLMYGAAAAEPKQVALVEADKPRIETHRLDQPKNLVLIYAESLEQAFSDPTLFGTNLTPNLSRLAGQSMHFTGMEQVSHTGWTMGGIIASLCALPIDSKLGVNNILTGIEAPLPNSTCLADVLSAYDYQTTYIGGASSEFAGKKNFLVTHGFNKVLGRNELTSRVLVDYQSGWGLYDDSLLRIAKEELASFDRQVPFLLTLLTLDTHAPGYVSASCHLGSEPNLKAKFADSSIIPAVRCSDHLLAGFIEDILAEYPNTLVALFSDHLAHQNDVASTLNEVPKKQRKLRFFVSADNITPGTITRFGTHFDVMPTLMDLMGIAAYTRHNAGRSLIQGTSGWLELGEPDEIMLSGQALGLDLQLPPVVHFELQGPFLQIGERRIQATHAGLPLKKSIYAIEFDSSGALRKIFSARDFDHFMANHPTGYVVGLSNNRHFNQMFASDAKAATIYFAGQLNPDKLTTGELWWQASVNTSQARSPD